MTFYNKQFISTGLDIAALTALKAGAVSGQQGLEYLGAGLGGFAYYNIGGAIKEKGQAVSNAYWNVLSTLASVVIGIFYWKEELDKSKLIGVGLGVASLYFLSD